MRRSITRLSARAMPEPTTKAQVAARKLRVASSTQRKATAGAPSTTVRSQPAFLEASPIVRLGQTHEGAGEGACVERLQVVDPLAHADQLDWRIGRLGDRDEHAPPRRAV